MYIVEKESHWKLPKVKNEWEKGIKGNDNDDISAR